MASRIHTGSQRSVKDMACMTGWSGAVVAASAAKERGPLRSMDVDGRLRPHIDVRQCIVRA